LDKCSLAPAVYQSSRLYRSTVLYPKPWGPGGCQSSAVFLFVFIMHSPHFPIPLSTSEGVSKNKHNMYEYSNSKSNRIKTISNLTSDQAKFVANNFKSDIF
jgi:hypothetical protein